MLYLRSKPKPNMKPHINSMITSTPQLKELQPHERMQARVEKPIEDHQKSEKSEPKKTEYQSTFDQLFRSLTRTAYRPNNKVSIIGAGDTGMAAVFSLLTKGITNDISIIDFNDEKLKGELMDLQFGSKFLPNVRLRAGKDFAISSDSKICVLAPCCTSVHDDENVDQVQVNAEVLKAVIPQLLKYSPNTILLVAIDPVDMFSYLAWQISELPKGRVIGTGTNLYTATFQYLLADRLGLSPSACHGYIIGENGYSCVPVWSGVTAGGVHLQRLNPDIGTENDPENWAELHRQVLLGEQEVRDHKGGNSWATALSIADICASVLYDKNCVRPLSTYVKGEYNINDEVFLSVPCVVGGAGVTDIVRLPLSPTEITQLQRSADIIKIDQNRMKIVQ
ncbi:hypothetical protein evm_002178 [Chilo suppressalis]|nr:hypothetical protein evm_002178 [Chilo suppressalis]